jgi:hypothetical protein
MLLRKYFADVNKAPNSFPLKFTGKWMELEDIMLSEIN